MTGAVIGMDPHRRSVTIEVMAPDEAVLDGGRYATDGRVTPRCSATRSGGRTASGPSRAATGSAGTSGLGLAMTKRYLARLAVSGASVCRPSLYGHGLSASRLPHQALTAAPLDGQA